MPASQNLAHYEDTIPSLYSLYNGIERLNLAVDAHGLTHVLPPGNVCPEFRQPK